MTILRYIFVCLAICLIAVDARHLHAQKHKHKTIVDYDPENPPTRVKDSNLLRYEALAKELGNKLLAREKSRGQDDMEGKTSYLAQLLVAVAEAESKRIISFFGFNEGRMEKLSEMDQTRKDAKLGAELILSCRRRVPINGITRSLLERGDLGSWQDIKDSYQEIINLNNQVVEFTVDKLSEYCLIKKGKKHKNKGVQELIETLARFDAELKASINVLAERVIAIASHAIIRSQGYDLWFQLTTQLIPKIKQLSNPVELLNMVEPAWTRFLREDPTTWRWPSLRQNLVAADNYLAQYEGNQGDYDLIAKVEAPRIRRGQENQVGSLRITGMQPLLQDFVATADICVDLSNALPVLPPDDSDLLA